ncbi:hypothetical protein GA0061093_107154 [Rhodococcus qingshengii]|nr:hypothetical protein GA0061093_107154 [Rhodococcus qingshengii]
MVVTRDRTVSLGFWLSAPTPPTLALSIPGPVLNQLVSGRLEAPIDVCASFCNAQCASSFERFEGLPPESKIAGTCNGLQHRNIKLDKSSRNVPVNFDESSLPGLVDVVVNHLHDCAGKCVQITDFGVRQTVCFDESLPVVGARLVVVGAHHDTSTPRILIPLSAR